MARDIKEYVSKCELCAKRKAVGSSKAPLNPIPPPTHVWQIMAMDLMGPLTPSGPDNHVYFSYGRVFDKICDSCIFF